jgi:exosortase
LCLAALGATAAWYGTLNDVDSLVRLGAVAVPSGLTLSVLPWRDARRLLPVFGALLFLIPLPAFVKDCVSLPLQQVNSRTVGTIADAFHLPVERMGSLFRMNHAEVSIDAACNGLRLFWSLLLVSYAVCFAFAIGPIWRLLILAASPGVALACNLVRLTATIALYSLAPTVVASTFHDVSGWLMIAGGWLIPYSFVWAFHGTQQDRPAAASVTSSPNGARGFTGPLRGVLAACCLLATLFASWSDAGTDDHRVHLAMDRASHLLERIPYRLDRWVGEDVPLPAHQRDVLQPDLLLHRRYCNLDDGQAIVLIVVFHADGRSHAGHLAPRCYAAHGWTLDHDGRRECPVGRSNTAVTSYEFSRTSAGSTDRLTVAELIHWDRRPTQRRSWWPSPSPSRSSLTRIQVLNDGRLSESDRNGFLSRVEEIVAPYLRSDPAAIREALATNAM